MKRNNREIMHEAKKCLNVSIPYKLCAVFGAEMEFNFCVIFPLFGFLLLNNGWCASLCCALYVQNVCEWWCYYGSLLLCMASYYSVWMLKMVHAGHTNTEHQSQTFLIFCNVICAILFHNLSIFFFIICAQLKLLQITWFISLWISLLIFNSQAPSAFYCVYHRFARILRQANPYFRMSDIFA